jgi:hypothetical protein
MMTQAEHRATHFGTYSPVMHWPWASTTVRFSSGDDESSHAVLREWNDTHSCLLLGLYRTFAQSKYVKSGDDDVDKFSACSPFTSTELSGSVSDAVATMCTRPPAGKRHDVSDDSDSDGSDDAVSDSDDSDDSGDSNDGTSAQ